MLKPAKRRTDTAANAVDGEPQQKKTAKPIPNGKGKFDKTTKPNAFRGKPSGGAFGGGNAPKGKFAAGNKFNKFSGGGAASGNGGNKFNKFAGKRDGNAAAAATEEKKDWAKFKKEKKDLKLKRKQSKDSYEITIEAKQIYEKLKCRRTEQKSQLVEKLYNLFSAGDTIKKIVMAHDTARILQCMLKFAAPALRDQLSERLLPHAVEMCQSKYSHFCVLRMLKYGSPATKTKLVDSLFGHIVKLACHNISSKILDHIYLSVASGQQKIHMRQEFYGELYRKAKDDNIKELADTYKQAANMKASIMGAVKSNLEHVANKQLVDSSLVHAVMLEYLQACDAEKMEETVSAFAALIPLMLTTKEGSQAAIICFYQSSTKNRRAIIKNIKEHLIKIATHEHGHVFLVAVLNALDDTKATKKAIYDNLDGELQTLVANQYGRRVVQWLVSPANTNCFHPGFINSIEQGLQYGKKDKEVRRKEILEQIEEPIAKAITENASFWLSTSHIGLVTADILQKLSASHFVKAATALCNVIVQPDWRVTVDDDAAAAAGAADKKQKKDVESIIAAATKQRKQKIAKQNAKKNEVAADDNGDNAVENSDDDDDDDDDDDEKAASAAAKTEESKISVAGIEEAGMHIVLKKIIKQDKEHAKEDAAATFGSLLLQQLNKESLSYWLTVNRACFILLNIVEQNDAKATSTLQQLLEDNELQATLKKQKFKGAQLLAQKLAA